MQRRRLLLGVGAFLATASPLAARIFRLGYLSIDLAGSPHHLHGAFLQAMRERGYVEGRNLLIEYRDAGGQADRLPALAADLVALKVDAIFTGTTPAAVAALKATRTIPIVFIGAGDPVSDGLVASLARPGGNVTGLSSLTPDRLGKCLELLMQATPASRRIAMLWQPGAAGERTERETLQVAADAASTLGVSLLMTEARGAADIERAFADMARARATGLAVWTSAMFLAERGRIVQLAERGRLPAVYTVREYVDAGGLMAYSHSQTDLNRRAAGYVDKIFKGARPADLPVEQPTRFELVISLKTARGLDLALPRSLTARADELIG